MASFLLQLETEIADRLLSLPFFDVAGIEVLVSPQKNIVSVIQEKIAKIKTLVAPKIVGAGKPARGLKGTYFEEIRIAVGVFQNPLLKGDLPSALAIAEYIHDPGLKGWTPDSLSSELVSDAQGIEAVPDERLNIWSCNFIGRGGPDTVILPQVAAPVVTGDQDNNEFTITCATPGAAIYYTVNGTHPSPRNGALYTGRVPAVVEDFTVKARAWLAGYQTSNLTTQPLTFSF